MLFITNRHNVRLKKLDVEQRQADHNQELRKLYTSKRIEAGEQFVSRLAAGIDRVDSIRMTLLTSDFDEEADNAFAKQMVETFQKMHGTINDTLFTKPSSAHLYFDDNVLEQKTGSVLPRLMVAEKRIVDVVNDKRRIWEMFNNEPAKSQSKENLGRSYHQRQADLTEALDDYNDCLLEYREYLVRTCTTIRTDLAKYDLPRT
jgi:hypothetical protein